MSTAPIITQSINNLTVSVNNADTTLNLMNYFDDPFTTGLVANFQLSNSAIGNGLIRVLLFDQTGAGAPLTVANFQNYVNSNRYVNTIIHRSVPGFVIQGGGFTINNLTLNTVTSNAPVLNEFSPARSNVRGTIAMAKLGGDPNSATNQWFFNLADNSGGSASLDTQNGGFTVFGQVLSSADLATMDAIASAPVYNGTTINPAFTNLPLLVDNPAQPAITRDDNFIRYSSITISQYNELQFTIIGNSNPTLVSPSISGNQLVLDYLPNQTGSSNISIRATDLLGDSTDYTFSVTVNPVNVAPTNLTLSNTSVNENSLNGTIIGTFSTTDANSGDTFTYQLKTGTGTLTDTINPFIVVGNTLQVKGVINFETKSKYVLTVRTTDAAGAFFEKAFTINVLDLTTNTIVGTTAAESFVASNEVDNIQAMDGNDTVTVALTNLQSSDRFEGGLGNDTLVFTGGTASQKLTLNLANTNQFASLTGATLSGVVIKTFENVTLSNFGGFVQVSGTGTANKLTGGAGNDILSGLGGNDLLTGNAGSDRLTGGLGDDKLYLGANDSAADQVFYTSGDGIDTVYQFVRGSGGDQLRFTGITSIDVRTINGNTEFRVGDGIAGNTGFGSGALLLKTVSTTGFGAGDEGVNLFNLTTSTGGFLFS